MKKSFIWKDLLLKQLSKNSLYKNPQIIALDPTLLSLIKQLILLIIIFSNNSKHEISWNCGDGKTKELTMASCWHSGVPGSV